MAEQYWNVRGYGKLLRRRSRIRLLFAGWRAFLTIVSLLVIGYFALAGGIQAHGLWQEYWLQDARRTQATVTARDVEQLEITNTHHGKDHTKHYHYLEYRFALPDGRQFHKRVRVSPGLLDTVTEGGPVDVEYAADRPWINRPLANRSDPMPSVIVVLVGLGLGLTLLAVAWIRAGRDETLVANGRLAEAEIVERLEARDHLPLRLRFRYKPHCAPACEGVEEVFAGDPLLDAQVGDRMTVIYDPARPESGRVLRPHLARLLNGR